MTTVFDFVNDVSHGKQNILTDENEKQYVPYLVNRALSYFPDTLFYANDMNRFPDLPKDLQHNFLLHTLRARKRFSAKWAKPVESADLELIQQAYECNARVATQFLSILSEDEIKILREKQQVGGVK